MTYSASTPTNTPHHGVLPIKPELLQYVVWRERLLTSEHPLLVPGLGPIAAALDMILVSGEIYLESKPIGRVDIACSARLHYRIHDLMHLQADRLYVCDAGAEMFSRFLEQLMRDDLSERILRGKRDGIQEKIVVERFLNDTGLNEWRDFETEKKGQYRLRKHRGVPKIRGHNLMRALAS